MLDWLGVELGAPSHICLPSYHSQHFYGGSEARTQKPCACKARILLTD